MLSLKAGKSAVTFEYTDDNMTASWTVRADDGEARLLSIMRFVIGFVESQNGHEPLPERIPGMALGMAQTAHPAPPEAPVNGWAAPAPEIPEHLQGEWELNTPDGEG